MDKENEYPATHIVHWATGPVACCKDHAAQLVGLGGMLGTHTAVTEATEGAQCINCINENKAA